MFRRSATFAACLAMVLLVSSPAPGRPALPPLRVLQLNLCDSGYAGCFSGRAVPAAATLMRDRRPDVVTLNEICDDDVSTLGAVLHELYPGDTVVRAFRPAYDRRSGRPFLCRNGRVYGIGLLAHLRSPRYSVDGGLYPAQDVTDPEERAWVCVHAPGAYLACTTHLANTKPSVALAQCVYLFGTAVAGLRARSGYEPTVLAGDLNLPSVAGCRPSGYADRNDGAVQHVFATGDFLVTTSDALDLSPVTDHPGLLVTLAMVRAD
ncbi:endonuclease/exonuclease/phosphatase family protein [Dactylosporangium sp. CA-139066]|uniref:endonuclease/exonuclease/phosphatase family protein n=1 Tax=Dactylosporangium sp. CA-139066 TaxID=3239930 RepID=UPI003D8F01D6